MTILQKLAAPITSAFAAVTGGDMLDTAEYRRTADAKFRPPAFAPKSRTWTDEPPDGQKRLPAPLPVPRLTPDAPPDLAEAEGQLVFLVEQRNTIQAELNRFPRSSTTPIPDALARQRQYADRFGSRVDLANEPAADLSLALLVLRNPEGLISAAGPGLPNPNGDCRESPPCPRFRSAAESSTRLGGSIDEIQSSLRSRAARVSIAAATAPLANRFRRRVALAL